MENERLIELITKELSQDISIEEFKELGQLLELSENQETFDDLKTKWEASENFTAKHKPNTKASWLAFKNIIDSKETKVFSIRPLFYRVAAVLIIGFGLGYFYFQNVAIKQVEYFTQLGETKQITLPDNSQIWLNESSYLAYNQNYNKDQREVILKGEAFFEVEKNAEKPFVVLSHEAKTQVLGTSFNILAYEDQQFVEIDVNSGKVAFSKVDSDDNEVLLNKGESARLDLASLALHKSTNQSPNYASWKTKKLIFEDAKLIEVIHDLNEYFNLNIQLSSSLTSCKLTSVFSDPTIDEILEVLKFTLNITIQDTEKGITLDGLGC